MIAGVGPVQIVEVRGKNATETLRLIEETLGQKDLAAFFTLSYDLGLKLQNIPHQPKSGTEPDVFIALHDTVIVHDYTTGKTSLHGNEARFDELEEMLGKPHENAAETAKQSSAKSNFTRAEYVSAVEAIQEQIRSGYTYQTNLTQQIAAQLPCELSPATVFKRLRRDHPAPFAAFIEREGSTVVSASPERFFKIKDGIITTSPIKGTRPRGETTAADDALKNELLTSEKDRAENTMIVDLLRNDIGRVCEFGSVKVEKLCDLEEHPTLFHLVSTISGKLRHDASLADILKAVFPCGSITGAPKIKTMQIIEKLEPDERGLSMGAIGYRMPKSFGVDTAELDMSVAIRTMVIRGDTAVFNVGGGIVIDSRPESEYDESLLKAKALLAALGAGNIS